MINNVIAFTVEKGEMTQSEAEEYFNLKNYMIMSLMGSFVMGLITTSIVAIFTRKKAA